MIDEAQLAAINKTAMETKAAFDAGKFKESTDLWGQTEQQCTDLTGGVNFYNILDWGGFDSQVQEQNKLYYGWDNHKKTTGE